MDRTTLEVGQKAGQADRATLEVSLKVEQADGTPWETGGEDRIPLEAGGEG